MRPITASLLNDMLQNADIVSLFDVRPATGRAVATIAHPRPVSKIFVHLQKKIQPTHSIVRT